MSDNLSANNPGANAAGGAADTDVAIEMIGVSKSFGAFEALKDVHLKVMKGERIVLCGPSGSGKSTLIRCINRLEEHEKGRLIVDGIELTRAAQVVNNATFRPFTVYALVALIYFTLCFPLSRLADRLERRLGRHLVPKPLGQV